MYLGLDLSLSATGIAVIDDKFQSIFSKEVAIKSISSVITDRYRRYNLIKNGVIPAIKGFKLKGIAIEGQAFGAKGRITDIAESKALIIDEVLKMYPNVPIIEVAPSQVKKYILGIGRGQKSLMIKEVYKKYNFDTDSDNIADAFVLACVIKGYLKIEECELKYQQDIIKKLRLTNKF